MLFKASIAASLVAAVSAHQNWHQFWVNDVTPGYQVGIRMPPSNSPVTDVTSNDMACNVNGSNVPSGVQTIPANEGDKIEVQWDSSGHPGPITHFLYGPVDNAAMTTGIGAGWFKIDELDYVNGTWANAIMQAQNMTYTFNLPKGLTSGEYLLRSEMEALHGAQTIGGAQFYIGCAQLKITGTGGTCGPTISLPGAYKANDTDIYIPDVYYGFEASTFKAPGGAVATCAGSGAQSTVAASSATTTAAVSASMTPVASSSVANLTGFASPTISASASSITAAAQVFTNSTTTAGPTATAVASSVVAAFSSLTSNVPSAVLTSAAPTATVTTSSGTTVSTAGLSVSELISLLRQILIQVLSPSTSSSTKARRHARDLRAA